MGPALIGAAKVASQLAPLALGLFHHRPKTPNIQGILDRYRLLGPDAYLSESDRAAAKRAGAGVAAGAARAGEIQRTEANRQVQARRLGGPAAAALADSAAATEAQGRENAATIEANQLYQTGKEKQDTLFGAELGAANIAAQRADQRDQSFWNSMIDLSGATSALWQPASPVGTTTSTAGSLPPTYPTPTPVKPGTGPRIGSGLAPYHPQLAPRPTFRPKAGVTF